MDPFGIFNGLGAGALGYFGAQEAQRASSKIAQKQMDFQERMSNTSYQRAVQDMTKAGINPIAAFSLGGASTPQGASSQAYNSVGAGVSSALAARIQQAELENLTAQNANLLEQSRQIASQTRLNSALAAGAELDVDAKAAKLPTVQRQADIDNSIYGQTIQWINKLGELPILNWFSPKGK